MKKLITFILIFVTALCLVGCNNEAAGVGIIGGADGPTAMFVTSSVNWLRICGLIGVSIATILIVLIIYRNKKKK